MVENNTICNKLKRGRKTKTSVKSAKSVLKIPKPELRASRSGSAEQVSLRKEDDFEAKQHSEIFYKQPEIDKDTKVLTAHDILTKTPEELDQGKRELHSLVRRMKMLTAIMLGNQQNKELSKVLDTDKSFTSKQIKELENEGLIKRETDGREVKYEVDKFNLLKFLSTKVTIKWKDKDEDKK